MTFIYVPKHNINLLISDDVLTIYSLVEFSVSYKANHIFMNNNIIDAVDRQIAFIHRTQDEDDNEEMKQFLLEDYFSNTSQRITEYMLRVVAKTLLKNTFKNVTLENKLVFDNDNKLLL